MEENLVDVEQSPNDSQENEIQLGQSENGDSTIQYGKFNNVNDLLSAYNNLQAEFTRKSQKLAELSKSTSSDQLPQYEREDWHNTLGEFLTKNSEAKKYAKDICQILIEDKDMAKSPNSLDLAWAKVMEKHYVSPGTMQNEDFYEKYVKNNKEIKEKIIKEYLDEIVDNSLPNLISSDKGSVFGVTGKTRPSTLAEAKGYVENLFRMK